MKYKHHDQMVNMLIKALSSGAIQRTLTLVEWDLSGNCRKPFLTEMAGRPPPDHSNGTVGITKVTKNTLRLDLQTRCRGCPECLKYRTSMWAARSLQETRQAVRTWFCTLTLRPEEQYKYLSMARDKLAKQSIDYDLLTPLDRMVVRNNLISREITLFLKRVRKNSGARIKYLCVCEAHKSGDPHYHLLIHEQSLLVSVRKDCLKRSWRLGFSAFKLVENPRQATYVTKYLSKSLLARVRASQRYGRT